MTDARQRWETPTASSSSTVATSRPHPRHARRSTNGKSAPTKQLDQIPASSYTDAESALDAGIQLEEKAERFAVGDKAIKFYRLSLDVYRRALLLQSNNADAAYNAARVLFVLATTFSLPPTSLITLQDSIKTYAHALSLSLPISSYDGLPSAFFLDVQFNMAVAQLTLAEQLDRLGLAGYGDQRTHVILQEAIGNFENVLRAQETVLKHQLDQESQMDGTDVERPPLIDGTERTEHNGSDSDDMAADDQYDESDSIRAEYTTSLITPASALETIANLHSAAILLLDCSAEDYDLTDTAVRIATHYHDSASSIYATYPDGERRSPDNDWNEQVAGLRFAPLEVKIAALAKVRYDTQRQQLDALSALLGETRREASALLESSADPVSEVTTTAGRAKQKIHTQRLEQLGDLCLTLSRFCLGRIHDVRTSLASEVSPQEHVALVQAGWQTCTLTSKLLLLAVKALDASNAGQLATTVLGTSHVVNPAMRRRAALYTGLSNVSVLRSNDVFTSSGAVTGVDEGTRKTLLDNARIYARKALTEVGLGGWLSQVAVGKTSSVSYQAPHGGLDSIVVDVDASLALLRALALRAVASDPAMAESAKREAATFCVNLATIFSSYEVADTWRACLGLEPESAAQVGKRVLEQAIGEEGEGAILPIELAFWDEVGDALMQGLKANEVSS